jgi:hypothetical protein
MGMALKYPKPREGEEFWASVAMARDKLEQSRSSLIFIIQRISNSVPSK